MGSNFHIKTNALIFQFLKNQRIFHIFQSGKGMEPFKHSDLFFDVIEGTDPFVLIVYVNLAAVLIQVMKSKAPAIHKRYIGTI
ncbi:hypothetical protein FHS45_004019 [Thalassobacillus devorans]|uniref:hypothetical protein n=1 Tax=Thalassobacillus devorans TaxID=279813 RepID=UPI0011DC8AD4|nr:hypothetical protein [Thalassobacillus devorans]NIK30860.1 hypothetical protein [Thalassobacillus devorans]